MLGQVAWLHHRHVAGPVRQLAGPGRRPAQVQGHQADILEVGGRREAVTADERCQQGGRPTGRLVIRRHRCRMAAVVFWLLLFVVIQPADSIFGPWKDLLTAKYIRAFNENYIEWERSLSLFTGTNLLKN